MKAFIVVVAVMLCFCSTSQSQTSFENFSDKFVTAYKGFNIPDLELSYVANLQQIPPEATIEREFAFFREVSKGLAAYNVQTLTPQQQTDYNLIKYETALNLQKLSLEKKWTASNPAGIPPTGLYTIPFGKEWYAYFLKKWVAADVTPDEIYQFGLKEVERVKKHIEDIRLQTGMDEDRFYNYLNDSSFFIHNQAKVQQAFEHTKTIILQNIGNVFYKHTTPPVAIVPGADATLAQTPGYYNNDTFYYNLFNKPYNKRQVDWLFIHEAIPGHHYQNHIDQQANHSKVQRLFYYLGFMEGWAAYTEELGKQLGVYKTPFDELGKWEWDIVRSVRVPLDVGINYYGWTDEQALSFWKKNIRGQDEIAMREINRIKRWPAQVVSYKYGALQIIQWKKKLQQQQGKNFNIKDFHNEVLNHGSLPLFMVEKNVMG